MCSSRIKLRFGLSAFFLALSCSLLFASSVGDDEDWVKVQSNVRFVNLDRAESQRGSLYKSLINGRYAAEMPFDDKWHWVVESDRPEYKFMTNFGSEFFTRYWYFNSDVIQSLPPVNGIAFVKLVKARNDKGNYDYFRVYQYEGSRELVILFPDDPFFGRAVYRTGESTYPYYFTAGAYTWYFSLQ